MSSLFPGALDTTASLFTAVNSKTTPLTGFHNSTITTITLGDTTGAPANGYCTIDGEAILYTAKTATTLTGCTRHADGTAAASHNDKATVKFGLVADHHNSLVQAVMALEAKVGAGVSGIDGAQMKAGSIAKSKLAPGVGFAPLFLRVHLSGDLADAIPLLIAYDVVDQDDPYPPTGLGNWNVGGKRWIAPATGSVVAMWRVTSLQGPAQNDTTGSLYKNGVIFRRGNEATSQAINHNSSIGMCILRVVATDYLQVYRDYRSAVTAVHGDAAGIYTTLDLMFIAD